MIRQLGLILVGVAAALVLVTLLAMGGAWLIVQTGATP